MNVIIVLKEACFRDAVSVSTALLILILIPRPGPKTDLSHGHRLICGFSDMEIISELYYQASNSQITEGESGLVEINITILPFVLYIYIVSCHNNVWLQETGVQLPTIQHLELP